MNLKDLMNNVGSFFQGATNKVSNFVQQNPTPYSYAAKQLQPVVNNIGQRANNFFSQKVPDFMINNPLVPPAVRNQPAPTIGQYFFTPKVTEGGNLPTIKGTSRTLLENVLPSFIGVTPLPKATGWSLPQSILTGTAFTGLEKVANYPNEQVFDPLNMGMKFGMGGLKFGEPNVKPNTQPQEVQQYTPKQRLANLLTYDDSLRRMGYSPEQINKISAVEARKIIETNTAPFSHWSFKTRKDVNSTILDNVMREESQNVFTRIRNTFQPIFGLKDDVKTLVEKWDAGRKSAQVEANMVNLRQRQLIEKLGITPQDEWKLVQYSQDPNPNMQQALGLTDEAIARAQPLLDMHSKFNDAIFNEAVKSKIDINYLQNHILQAFKENPEQIDNIMQAKGLGATPGFAHHRNIPSYIAALEEVGLHPKYTTFGQLNAEMYSQLQKAVANKQFSDALLQQKVLLPSNRAPVSWEVIDAKFFPKAEVRVSGNKTIEVPYKAPQQLARYLNQLFGGQPQSLSSQVLEGAAKTSGQMQDVALSSGGYSVNSFTIGQAVVDITTGIGDVLTGHPIRGAKIAINPFKAMLRAFVPGLSEKFEINHESSIKQMAGERIGYGGVLDYKKLQANVTDALSLETIKAKGGKTWNSIINSPTFSKFMFQKKVELFEILRDHEISRGKSEPEAIKLSADKLKSYEGLLDSLGRNPDVDNALKTVFLAPKYRESLLGKGANLLRAFTVDILNPKFELSRKLGLGMIVTYFLYNELNKQLNNGKSMSENPPGRELELVIPDKEDPNKYYSIPFMPSSTAIYRRIFGTGAALVKGDTQEAGRQVSSLFSIPLSKGAELFTNKDYFGRDVIRDESYGSLPKQYGLWAAKSFGPGFVREPIQYAQDMESYQKKVDAGKTANKPSAAIATLRAFELPLKQGTFSSQFYSIRDNLLSMADPETVNTYKQLHPENNTTDTYDKADNMSKAMLRLSNFDVVKLEGMIDFATAGKLGRDPNPFYQLTPEQQKLVLWTRAMPPGSSEKSQLYKTNIAWLEPYWDKEAAYYSDLNLGSSGYDAPQPSTYVKDQMDRKNWKDIQVQDYLNAKRIYDNQTRVSMGLPELPAYAPFSKRYFTNIKIKKIAKLKVKTPKSTKLSKVTTKKTKTISLKTIKVTKLPEQTIKDLKIAKLAGLSGGKKLA